MVEYLGIKIFPSYSFLIVRERIGDFIHQQYMHFSSGAIFFSLKVSRVEAQTQLSPWSLTQILKRSKGSTDGKLVTKCREISWSEMSRNLSGWGPRKRARVETV